MARLNSIGLVLVVVLLAGCWIVPTPTPKPTPTPEPTSTPVPTPTPEPTPILCSECEKGCGPGSDESNVQGSCPDGYVCWGKLQMCVCPNGYICWGEDYFCVRAESPEEDARYCRGETITPSVSYVDAVTSIRIGVAMLVHDADVQVFSHLPVYDPQKAYPPYWDWETAKLVHSGRDWGKDAELCERWYSTLSQLSVTREYVAHLILLRKAVLALGTAAWHYDRFTRDPTETDWQVLRDRFDQAETEWAEGTYMLAMLQELEKKDSTRFPMQDWSITGWDEPDLWQKYYFAIR